MTASVQWWREFPGAVTVCDRHGVILEMNQKAVATLGNGKSLVGANILDCHPEPARSKVRELLSSGGTNVYTIEKQGVRKLIYQSPWFEDGKMRGLVELSLVLPDPLPHHVRDKPSP
jgi:transcriptional regulator with PAS, ATPase and Fis domain